jgi:DNA repair exonuclease SbcCD ATPase subunit
MALTVTLEQFGCYLEKTTFTFPSLGLILLKGESGGGKCLARGTPVLLYRGGRSLVECVQVGDELIGDNGSPRKVLSVCSGEDEMYEIVPTKGRPYTVNSAHILTLVSKFPAVSERKDRGSFSVHWYEGLKSRSRNFPTVEEAEEFCGSLPRENVVDVPIMEFMKLQQTTQRDFFTFHVGVDFSPQDVPLDPYMFGYWLGDGTSAGAQITTADPEVVEYFSREVQKLDLDFHPREHYRYDISNRKGSQNLSQQNSTGTSGILNTKRGFVVKYLEGDVSRSRTFQSLEEAQKFSETVQMFEPKSRTNPFTQALRELDVLNNKNIPWIYLHNSRQVRLAVLAGLIDSDGYVTRNCVEITQKSDVLAADIEYLAFSLGFMVTHKKEWKSCMYKGEARGNWYNRLKIFGSGMNEIPTILPRKKLDPRSQVKRATVQGFKIEPRGMGPYHGFEIDGNGRFLLGDFTVTHNTTILEGINFALFGARSSDIINWHAEKQTCQVTLDYGGWTILRKKGPNLLRLTDSEDGETYEDEAAQAMINQRYGMQFTITNYITQSNSDSFFRLKPDKRMEFLEKLVLGDIDIKELKKRAKAKASERKNRLSQCVGEYKSTAREADALVKPVEIPFPLKGKYTEENVGKWRVKRSNNAIRLEKARKSLALYTEKKAKQTLQQQKHDQLSAQLREAEVKAEGLRGELEALPIVSVREIEERIEYLRVNKELSKTKEQLAMESQRYQAMKLVEQAQLEADLEKQTAKPAVVNILAELKIKAKTKERKLTLQKRLRECEAEAAEYETEQAYVTAIAELRETEQDLVKRKLRRNDRQRTLRERLQKCEGEVAEFESEEVLLVEIARLQELESELVKRKLRLKDRAVLHKCPKCAVFLRLGKEKLEVADAPPTEEKSEADLTGELRKARQDRAEYEKFLLELRALTKEMVKLRAELGADTAATSDAQPVEQKTEAELDAEIAEARSDLADYEESLRAVRALGKLHVKLEDELAALPVDVDIGQDYEALISDHAEQLREQEERLKTIARLKRQLENEEFSNVVQAQRRRIEERELAIRKLELASGKGNKCSLPERDDPDALQELLTSSKLTVQKHQLLSKQLTGLEGQIADLRARLAGVKLLEKDYESLVLEATAEVKSLEEREIEFKEKEETLAKYLQWRKAQEFYDEWQVKKEEAGRAERNAQKSLMVAETYVRKLKESEGVAVIGVIENINQHLDYYLERFFNHPISVRISSFNDKDKPVINIQVDYKGREAVPHKRLSGGERARIELAICLAIGDIVGCNLFLFDEVFGALSPELIEEITELLKAEAADQEKLFFFVCHQTSEGEFDHLVDLDVEGVK